MFFDDLPVGFTFETASRQIPLEEMVEFARKYDPQPFHIDEDAAKQTPYGGLIASGFQTMVVGFLLSLDANIWNEASLG
jgi:acyl dehydratase